MPEKKKLLHRKKKCITHNCSITVCTENTYEAVLAPKFSSIYEYAINVFCLGCIKREVQDA